MALMRKNLGLMLILLWIAGCTYPPFFQPTPLPPIACVPPSYQQAIADGVVSPDQQFVVSASAAGTAVYETQTQALLGCLDTGWGPPPTFIFSDDSQFLIVARAAGFPITLWQLAPDVQRIFSTNSELELYGVALSPDHQLLAAVLWDGQGASHYFGGTLKIWDVNSGQLIREVETIFSVHGFTDDGLALDITVCTYISTLCAATEARQMPVYP